MRIIVLLIMGFMLIIQAGNSLAEDLPDTVFPWGTYGAWKGEAERDSMRLALGFNFYNLAWNQDPNQVIDFLNDGFVVYPNQGPIIDSTEENYFKYAEAFYTLIEAEDEDLTIRFKYRNGSPSGDFWYYGEQTADSILGKLAWWHRWENAVIVNDEATNYTPFIRMKIVGNDTLETADVVARLYRNMGDYGADTTYILASEFYDAVGDTFYTEPVIVECNGFTLDKDRTVYYTIYSTGEAELYIDYLKVPDEWGIRLIDDHEWDNELILSAYYTFGGKRVAGWYMADEPNPEQYRSLAYIDNLIKANYALPTSKQLLTENKKELYLTKTDILK